MTPAATGKDQAQERARGALRAAQRLHDQTLVAHRAAILGRDRAIVAAYNLGLSEYEIAKVLEVARNAVSRARKREIRRAHNLTTPPIERGGSGERVDRTSLVVDP